MIDRAQSLLSLGNTVLVTLVLVIGTIAGGGYWVAQVNGDIETLQNDMARLQADMTETRSEIEELRAEVRTDVEDLRVDIAAMQSDVRVILEKIGNLEDAARITQTQPAELHKASGRTSSLNSQH